MRRLLTKLKSYVGNLPRSIVLTASVLLVGGIGAAAYYGYGLYDYVQHDNDFCLTCHLMQEPYERFAKSEHRDLGCKACHQPTLMARSQMALTQVLHNPDSLATHAEVPNERCEACHVEGDSAEWTIIANTAGHRVHLESADSVLRGVQCVKCHSSSVHEFAATDKTCGQAGCHENVKIQLGKMGKLTIHCAACHDFNKPVVRQVANSNAPGDSLHKVLQPTETQCLGCHAMRQRLTMPADDPHDGACGACHNPHDQATPAEAQKTCAGCHESTATSSVMHRGLEPSKLANCSSCHKAHDFKANAQACASCHSGITKDTRRAASGFQHAQHGRVQCSACHSSEREHGELKITSAAQCQSCHHNAQAAAACSSCHEASEFQTRRLRVSERFDMSVGARTRELTFDHRKHQGVTCAQCHRDPLTRSAAGVQCKTCHTEHHKPTETCMACHPPARQGVHTVQVHLGCAGSGCHSKLPVTSVPRTRAFCTVCHQNMVNHRPSGNCAGCHRLPQPRAG